ncbi:MAG: hypothetical protein KGZ30_01940 [Anaplasmataceae bacterium]|nr:hypothetical protein [Anaplasmataceae bacterium]
MSNLRQFLVGKEAIQAIHNAKTIQPHDYPKKALHKDAVLYPTLSHPFLKIYTVFIEKIGYTLSLLGIRETGARFVLHARYSSLKTDSYYQKFFGKQFLVRSINLPNLQRADVFAHPTMQRSALPDDAVRQLIDPSFEELDFLNNKGVCLGTCEWFAYLYFKTNYLFSNAQQHLIAIANQFKEGAPVEAQVLQKLQCTTLDESPHLHLSKKPFIDLSNTGTPIQQITRLTCSLLKAPPGFYTIQTSSHRLNWIKSRNNTSYLHDPNCGLIKNDCLDDHITMANILVTTYAKPYDSTLLKIKTVTAKRMF